MPPVTRGRSPGSTAIPRVAPQRRVPASTPPRAASTPAAAAARPAATAGSTSRVASPAATPAADRCTICLESMTSKRVVSLRPCGHSLHRTCALEWLETRCCTDAQQCPLCRAGIVVLTDAQGKRLLPVRAFGDCGQPTKRRVLTEAVHKTTLAYLQERIWEVECWMSEVQSDQGAALIEWAAAPQPRPAWHDVYLKDTADELAKLTRRLGIYKEMRVAHAAGGMRATAAELAEMDRGHPWCLQAEMELAREREVRERWMGWIVHPVIDPPTDRLRLTDPPPGVLAAAAAAPAAPAAPRVPRSRQTTSAAVAASVASLPPHRQSLRTRFVPPTPQQLMVSRMRPPPRPSVAAAPAAAASGRAAAAARPSASPSSNGRTTATAARATMSARDARARAREVARAARVSGAAPRPAWRT